MDIAISVTKAPIRLTDERWMHISVGHPEIADFYYEILETIENPEKIFEGRNGELIAKGFKLEKSDKFLVVIYRESDKTDGFVITAYLSNKLSELEKRRLLWEQQK